MANSPEPKKRYEALVAEIRAHDRAYYENFAPTIADEAYDRLYRELTDLEAAHPDWVRPDSPSQRVGGAPQEEFKKVARNERMMSLDNTYNEEELRDFDARVRKGLGHDRYSYVVEPKIDGLGIECRYVDGILALAATRGDGLTGEDVTPNVRTIRSVPLAVERPAGAFLPDFTVRGEVFLPNDSLPAINAERRKAELPEFKNPRNAAAGSLRLLDARETARRPLRAIFYTLVDGVRADKTHEASMERLKAMGLPTHPDARVIRGIDDVLAFCAAWKHEKDALPYDVDGLVLKVNEYAFQQELGVTAKFPRWAIAFKYEAEQATTRVNAIRIQVGRTGQLTPVADLEPVFLAGTTVARASLHNTDEVARKDVRVGDEVVIEKAGEIIPQVVRVNVEARRGKPRKFALPKKCPVCGGKVGKSAEEEVALRCLNGLACPAQKKESILYFSQRNNLNIDGLGPAIVDQLVDGGMIQDPADLFALTAASLSGLERMGEKSAQNLVAAIQAAKATATLPRAIAALGVGNVGEVAAGKLAEHAGSLGYFLETGADPLKEALETIHGVGPKMAEEVAAYFADPKNRKFVEKLIRAGLDPKYEKVERSGPLLGQTFCITGTLSKPRDEIKADIQRAGGTVAASVGKNVNFLVVGDDVGQAKLDKAKKHKTALISEAELQRMIAANGPQS